MARSSTSSGFIILPLAAIGFLVMAANIGRAVTPVQPVQSGSLADQSGAQPAEVSEVTQTVESQGRMLSAAANHRQMNAQTSSRRPPRYWCRA